MNGKVKSVTRDWADWDPVCSTENCQVTLKRDVDRNECTNCELLYCHLCIDWNESRYRKTRGDSWGVDDLKKYVICRECYMEHDNQ